MANSKANSAERKNFDDAVKKILNVPRDAVLKAEQEAKAKRVKSKQPQPKKP